MALARNMITKSFFSSILSRAAFRSSSFCRVRPLVSLIDFGHFPPQTLGGLVWFSVCSSYNSSPDLSSMKTTILDDDCDSDGCDFKHWRIFMDPPEEGATRDEIIDSYIKTLAMVLGSEEEARKQIYSVSSRHHFSFGCIVSEEISLGIRGLPRVRWVVPDCYTNLVTKTYGGEPFINGQAVPYDPKYHEDWTRPIIPRKRCMKVESSQTSDSPTSGNGENSPPNSGIRLPSSGYERRRLYPPLYIKRYKDILKKRESERTKKHEPQTSNFPASGNGQNSLENTRNGTSVSAVSDNAASGLRGICLG